MLRLPLLLLAVALVAGCDSLGPTEVKTQAVVSAFLEANAPLPTVVVTRTIPFQSVYDSTAVVPDATVAIERLGADGRVDARAEYRYDPQAFVYVPASAPLDAGLVVPGRTYRLVAVALGGTLTAETTVPSAFELLEAPPDEVVYQANPAGIPLRITLSSTPTRQSVYVASTRALAPDTFDPFERDGDTYYRSRNEPDRYGPVPFVRDLAADCETVGGFLECKRDPVDLFTGGTSPIINEASYRRLGDGTAIVDVPWLAFGFYGPSQVSLLALDDAYQDFVETQALQSGGSTISPGEIPNVATNVRGGLGVFGSFARVTARTTILER